MADGTEADHVLDAGIIPGVADLDLDRSRRRGFAEAVYCEGKSPAQVVAIAEIVGRNADVRTLFTRADSTHAASILSVLPDAVHDEQARVLAWPPEPPPCSGGEVAVVTAGTSDLPVAAEALVTLRYLGRRTNLYPDAGIAGLHRILRHVPALRRAEVIIVVAGMDGALPAVVSGLVEAPVIAVPTSVGYGAAFGGIAALLTMLNSCSPGVCVVNIDNGYGAGHLAAQITAGSARPVGTGPGSFPG